jgi:hypothetical protein
VGGTVSSDDGAPAVLPAAAEGAGWEFDGDAREVQPVARNRKTATAADQIRESLLRMRAMIWRGYR